MLGVREPEIYGNNTYKTLITQIKNYAKGKGVKIKAFQSNSEGKIVDKIHWAFYKGYDAIVINPGAYTHTSIAILDALKSTNIPTVEVHISNVNEREEFRKISYVGLYAFKTIVGEGFNGYNMAIDEILKNKKA